MIKIMALLIALILLVGCQKEDGINWELKFNESEQKLADAESSVNMTLNAFEVSQEQVALLQKNLSNTLLFHKYFDEAIFTLGKAANSDAEAQGNYRMFSYYYDDGYLDDAVFYCEKAREGWSASNVHSQKAKQYFIKAENLSYGFYTDLVKNYVELIDVGIDINWAMYEACEYYESASKAYDNDRYETGDSELAKGNLKIDKHDSLITTFNEISSRIDVIRETR